MNYDMERTATIIKDLRTKEKKGQEAVASDMEINIKTYQAVEQGIRGVKIDTLCIIADYYHVTLDYLITGNHATKSEWNTLFKSISLDKQERLYNIVSNIVTMLE